MELPRDQNDASGVVRTPAIRRYALVPAGRSERNAGVRRYKLARVGPPPGQLSPEREERLERVAGMASRAPATEEEDR